MSDLPNVKLTKLDTITKKTKVCDDFYVGAINVLNTTYLPKWSGETDAGYDERIAQTTFANMFAPVVDGLAGLVTRKAPVITGYDALDLSNVDLQQNDLASFMKSTIKKSITNGVTFISAETNKELNRAFLKRYSYQNLYSYLIKDDVLQQIVFREIVEVADGEFGLKEQERFVVFKKGGGAVWYIDENGDNQMKERDTWENSLKEIPILPVVTGKILSPFEIVPKLLDIANLNKVHLNLESNLANVLGVIGNPVPMFFGYLGNEEKDDNGNVNVTIGVKDALVFQDKQKEGAEYLEPKATGVGKIQEKIKETESQIDKLTFMILQNSDSNTVIDAQLNASKNTSFLSDVANEIEAKINKALQFMLELENKTVTKDAKVELNKDFDATMIDLDIAFKTLQAGDMSRETFYEILKTGKLPKDFKIEDENSKIENDTKG